MKSANLIEKMGFRPFFRESFPKPSRTFLVRETWFAFWGKLVTQKMRLAGVSALLVAAGLFGSCVSTASSGGVAEEGVPGGWAWGSFNDSANQGSSRIALIERPEEIDGNILMTYNISGEITDTYQYGYAGWYAIPDEATLELLKTARGFSFKIAGDGQAYKVMVSTADITDAAFYGREFVAKKDQETTVAFMMRQLAQPEDWGAKKPFNQDQAIQIQFQTTNNGKPGTFKVKVYDLRVIP
ncbi:MAG: CIA30 family protein [Treponema sp.]|jgi:hypothetical protein|nr:CIA30 family protein [Treponema sp.]